MSIPRNSVTLSASLVRGMECRDRGSMLRTTPRFAYLHTAKSSPSSHCAIQIPSCRATATLRRRTTKSCSLSPYCKATVSRNSLATGHHVTERRAACPGTAVFTSVVLSTEPTSAQRSPHQLACNRCLRPAKVPSRCPGCRTRKMSYKQFAGPRQAHLSRVINHAS